MGVHRAEGPAADRGEAAPPAQPTTVLGQSALAGDSTTTSATVLEPMPDEARIRWNVGYSRRRS